MMKRFFISALFSLLFMLSYGGNYYVITFSETGPMTVEGRHRDYIWIVPADSVKDIAAAEIYPFLIDINEESIIYIHNDLPNFCTLFNYDSDLQKLVKKYRKRIMSFKTNMGGRLRFNTVVYATPIQGKINKQVLLNLNQNTVYYSDSFTYWEEGFETDIYSFLSLKWFPEVPYRFQSSVDSETF